MEAWNLYLKFLDLFFTTAWFWSPFILAIIFFDTWMYYIQRAYWRKLDWMILEVKPPREVENSPKNMEQIFAGLWGVFGTVGNKYEKYIKGMMQDYFSFEIVGINGTIHFYLRTLRKYRNVVEAQVYSQYPQAEIKEAEDYVSKLPLSLPDKNWNLWGCKLALGNNEAYPIRTYQHLVEITKADLQFFDPLAGLMEIMAKLQNGEQIWIQVLFRPIDDKWQKETLKIAYKILGKKAEAPVEGIIRQDLRTWGEALGDFGHEFLTGTAAVPAVKKETNEPPSLAQFLSTGEKARIEGIEEKAAKKGYEAKVQWVYIGRKEIFTMAYVAAIMGIFNQFSNLNMNVLRPDKKTMTKANYLFAK